MRDICTESVVPVVPRSSDKALKFALIGSIPLSLALILFIGPFALLLTAVCAFMLYRHIQKSGSEYEYIHTNEIFDVDIVIRNQSRKQLCSVNLNQVSLVAPVDCEEMLAFSRAKVTDYSGNAAEDTLYAMVYSEDGKQHTLLLKMDEKMRNSLKQWIPAKVR